MNGDTGIVLAAMLGVVALACFGVHAANVSRRGHPEWLLWACNVSTLGLGIGLLTGQVWVVAPATLMLTTGLPSWLVGLLTGQEFIRTSALTHVGGLTVGLFATAQHGYPPGTLWWAIAAMVLLVVAARLFTSPEQNTNQAFDPWPDIEALRFPWPIHLPLVMVQWSGLLTIANTLLRYVFS